MCRYTNHGDDDAIDKKPNAGSDDRDWLGKATAVNGSYVSYIVSVTEKTTYEVYSAVSTPGSISGTLYVDGDNGVSKALTKSF